MSAATDSTLSKKDFETDQDVRWCPGCGDYSVLAAVQRFLPTRSTKRENYVFISGIGCSSRFPYYMQTYGFHTIHGRAPALTTGVKLTNPELDIWMITGDGDALSIGGNHLLHVLRRNLDINILLLNNRIYGLTKGQYSPTSEIGKVTGSSPLGSIDYPLNPLLVVLGAQATFAARTLDKDPKHMSAVLDAAANHKGTSFVEIFQNCNIFNDGAFDHVAEKELRANNQLLVTNGQPLIFGDKNQKGIAVENLKPKVIEFEAGNKQAAVDAGVLVYDESSVEMAQMLARLQYPEFPVPMGVLYKHERATFNELVVEQNEMAKKKFPVGDNANDNLKELFHSGDTWVV